MIGFPREILPKGTKEPWESVLIILTVLSGMMDGGMRADEG